MSDANPELIELTAKAIYESLHVEGLVWEAVSPAWREVWRIDARAALEVAGPVIAVQALREAADEVDSLYFGPDQHIPFTRGSAHRWGAKRAAKRISDRADRIEHDARCPHPKCPGGGLCCCLSEQETP